MELFKVVLLICTTSLPRAECESQTALQVINGPEARNELACGLQSQAFLASTAIGRGLTPNEYLKILCRRDTTFGARPIGPLAISAVTRRRAD